MTCLASRDVSRTGLGAVTTACGMPRADSKPAATIRAGETVHASVEEEHWYGATPRQFLVTIDIQEIGENGQPADWHDRVTDAEYDAAVAGLKDRS